jgi:hypothetical protein
VQAPPPTPLPSVEPLEVLPDEFEGHWGVLPHAMDSSNGGKANSTQQINLILEFIRPPNCWLLTSSMGPKNIRQQRQFFSEG